MLREQRVSRQDEFRIETIGGGFVHFLTGKIALETVLVTVVGTNRVLGAIGRMHFLLIEHDELRLAPGLSRPPDVTPKKEVPPVKAASDVVVAERFLRDLAVDCRLCLGIAIWFGTALTCREQKRDQRQAPNPPHRIGFGSVRPRPALAAGG